jgi:AraC-like DNA-binding protein
VISYVVNAISIKAIEMDHFIYIAASILIYSIGYFSLRQPQIFTQVVDDSVEKPLLDSKIETEERISYQKSGLTDEEAQSHLKDLLQIMDIKKPYLNSDLTLKDLAAELSISQHNLSEILNTQLNRNFYDFVNGYRIEEVKRRMSDLESEKYSLLAIAYDSGFNSKSAFNTIFKKQTNVTPSQYRSQLK